MNLKLSRWAWIVAALVLLSAGGTARAGVERLYVLDCGWIHAPDQSRWSTGINVGVPLDLSDSCYLIKHSSGAYMLWDTGLADALAAAPQGTTTTPNGLEMHRTKTLVGQLAELGLKPSDLKYIAISHHHADHSGNVDAFPTVRLLIQKAEFDFAVGLPKPPFSGSRPMEKLEGDKDVFGDGSVTILSTPGHTPGHESLLVKLPKTGAVVLSGDLAHFMSNWENRRVPGFNFDKDKSSASMQRIADVLAQQNAKLWINHDKPQQDAMRHSPQYYE